MDDADLDAVRRAFADLTGLFEDSALASSDGQGVSRFDDGRRCLRRVSTWTKRIPRHLIILERHLR